MRNEFIYRKITSKHASLSAKSVKSNVDIFTYKVSIPVNLANNKHQTRAEKGVDIRMHHLPGKRVHEGHNRLIIIKPGHMMVQSLNGLWRKAGLMEAHWR